MTFTADDLRNYLFEEPDEDDFESEEAYDAAYEKWEGDNDEFFYEGGNLDKFGTFKEVASWKGGDGHEMGRVFQHEESGRYFKAVGCYSSWDASEWEDLYECEPYEVVKTRYRKVEG